MIFSPIKSRFLYYKPRFLGVLAIFCLLFSALFLQSCKNETLPKPKAELALSYPAPAYKEYRLGDCPYDFNINQIVKVHTKDGCSAVLEYPGMNAALYLTYRNVNGDINKLLTDAQKLTYEHVIKADNIFEEKYVNEKHNVYGMFYDVSGNAASQSQFYVTDSVQHFLTGSIYFNVRPNYDSILPAADYLKKDIRYLMETITWKK